MAHLHMDELRPHVVPRTVDQVFAKYRGRPLSEDTLKAAIQEAVEATFTRTVPMAALIRDAVRFWAKRPRPRRMTACPKG